MDDYDQGGILPEEAVEAYTTEHERVLTAAELRRAIRVLRERYGNSECD